MPQFHRCCLPTPVILALTRDAAPCSSAASQAPPFKSFSSFVVVVSLLVRSFVRRLLLVGRFQALPTVVVRLSVCLSSRTLLIVVLGLGYPAPLLSRSGSHAHFHISCSIWGLSRSWTPRGVARLSMAPCVFVRLDWSRVTPGCFSLWLFCFGFCGVWWISTFLSQT